MTITFVRFLLLPCLVWVSVSSAMLLAAEPDVRVAAIVGETPVLVADVQRVLAPVLRGQKAVPAQLAALQAQALEQLVNRQLIQQYLTQNKQAAADYEIAQAIESMKAKLKEQKVAWDALLKKQGLDEADVRKNLSWELSWKKYLQQEVSDETLESFFEAHRREYDGSELGVSHILLRPVNSTNQAKADAIKQIKEIHAGLENKKMTFAEAAKKFSVGPSSEKGGELGFIPRRGVMDEAFSKAAFDLEIGEISPPVQTRFGYHIIRATKLQPGKKSWQDAREEMLPVLAQELFQKLSQAEREKATVKYTGVLPHLKPGTKQVVPASK